tara:strand:+ start:321 stop:1043 length:723 start_codon:yes stop_codon:yes gene_type:complete
MAENNMRNYLKEQGINIRKGKSWKLKSKKDRTHLKIKSWYGGNENKSLFYRVTQKNLEVDFQGDVGFETCLSYNDGDISFIVDSIKSNIKLEKFVSNWVEDLRSKEYKGSWKTKISGKKISDPYWDHFYPNTHIPIINIEDEIAGHDHYDEISKEVYICDCNLKDSKHESLRYVVADPTPEYKDKNGEWCGEPLWIEFSNLNKAIDYADSVNGCILDSEKQNDGIYISPGYTARKKERTK